MFKQKLYHSMIVLVMLVCAFMVGSTSASPVHAAGLSVSSTSKTQIVKAPKKLCDFLKKSTPTHAGDPHICDFKYVSTDTYVNTQNSSARPLSASYCGSTAIVHTASFTDLTFLWGFSQTTTFHWGNTCSYTILPTVSYHDCHSMWSYPPFVVSPNRCLQYPAAFPMPIQDGIVAEDDINVATYLGGTFVASIYSAAGQYPVYGSQITDWWT